ncbi:triose-phosphate isomerase [Pectobacterium actinidiae]|uniref:Triosephosphate isomerase n=1 Tax=Pectobacterium actinidiae TaxID=1507808 RepID=A0A1V2R185_9GAMM|nr:triose-phosphate isomerase [Pectobacterium actinidiae]GLW36413.1 triosephosphate isomerase [Pectobacterium carotovorum subsp. carotovorum]KHN90584.1 triosephosphate isomerase [Pectobacterium actinidiae]MDY4314408.1 triose-phosphate isomerase [Pectobacterium actinidiae]ONK02613.1 triose-phosphate isomerase [Pectobacterium actinidiae]ONK03769.1 triose-phosphate isomerase [Pectobacterium actinidiae]
MKKVMIGTSWKMNKTRQEAIDYCAVLSRQLNSVAGECIQPFVIPPFMLIREVTEYLSAHKVNCLTGAQNMHYADSGAWTGEVSPVMVCDCGATLVELGHSERRQHFAENDADIQKKVQAALRYSLRPLVCVGDSAQEKAWGVSRETVIRQMKIALAGLHAEQAENVIIAYEPIWAIGEGGTPATAQEAQAIHAALRQALVALYDEDIASRMTLLYGGSVNPHNTSELIQCVDIDGLFIGRSAWDAEHFCQLVRSVSALLNEQGE